MRKPRDYDAELKALEDRTKELKTRKVQELGELVIATGRRATGRRATGIRQRGRGVTCEAGKSSAASAPGI